MSRILRRNKKKTLFHNTIAVRFAYRNAIISFSWDIYNPRLDRINHLFINSGTTINEKCHQNGLVSIISFMIITICSVFTFSFCSGCSSSLNPCSGFLEFYVQSEHVHTNSLSRICLFSFYLLSLNALELFEVVPSECCDWRGARAFKNVWNNFFAANVIINLYAHTYNTIHNVYNNKWKEEWDGKND